MSTATRPIGIGELLRAHRALIAGDFLRHPPRTCTDERWGPVEPVLPIVAAAGGTGASTLALALATAAGGRVVECAGVTASGLAAAPTAELGRHETGWLQGRRDEVLVERPARVLTSCAQVPVPTSPPTPPIVTVVDVAWELGQVLGTPSWLAELLRDCQSVVVTASATVPGLRRLEAALAMLAPTGPPNRVAAAVLGPPRRRWPRAVARSAGPLTTALIGAERLVVVPPDARLAARGLDTTPLPGPLLDTAAHLLHLTDSVPAWKDPL